MYQIIQTSLMYLSEIYLDLWILVADTILDAFLLPSVFNFPDNGIVFAHTNFYATIVAATNSHVASTINTEANNTADSNDSLY